MCLCNVFAVCVDPCVTPLKIADLSGDCLEAITGEAELSQGEDLTDAFREHTQTVVRQVQALQL